MFAALCWLALTGAPALACPMCKGALSPEEELKLAAAEIREKRDAGVLKAEQADQELAVAKAMAEQRIGLTTGMAYSIYFMLATLFSLGFGMAGMIVWAAREGLRRQTELAHLLASPSNELTTSESTPA
jgi:uncharacterized protein YbaR (Trm112 family)